MPAFARFPLSCGCHLHELIWLDSLLLGCKHKKTWFVGMDMQTIKAISTAMKISWAGSQ